MYYPNLLSPIRIGNHILKNRLLYGNALPHFLQGPETYPAEAMIRHYGDMAKNGAAIVTCSLRLQRGRGIDGQHATMMAVNDLPTQNYINQMTEAIRFYGSIAAFSIMQKAPDGFGVVDSDGRDGPPNHWNPPGPKKAMGKEEMNQTIDEIVSLAKLYQSLGFDMINLHMSYGTTIFVMSVSSYSSSLTSSPGSGTLGRMSMAVVWKIVPGSPWNCAVPSSRSAARTFSLKPRSAARRREASLWRNWCSFPIWRKD